MLPMRIALLASFLFGTAGVAQETGFRWKNPMPEGASERLEHGTYYSELMALDAGYVVYLPPGYKASESADQSYPVVYFLPGGRVGSEVKSVALAEVLDEWIRSGAVLPRIVVFVKQGLAV